MEHLVGDNKVSLRGMSGNKTLIMHIFWNHLQLQKIVIIVFMAAKLSEALRHSTKWTNNKKKE